MLCAFIIKLDALDLSTYAIICSFWLVWLTHSFFLSQICQIEWMNRPTTLITQNPHWCTEILYELYLDHVIPRSFHTMPFILYQTARLHPNWTTSRRIHISSWYICHPSIILKSLYYNKSSCFSQSTVYQYHALPAACSPSDLPPTIPYALVASFITPSLHHFSVSAVTLLWSNEHFLLLEGWTSSSSKPELP